MFALIPANLQNQKISKNNKTRPFAEHVVDSVNTAIVSVSGTNLTSIIDRVDDIVAYANKTGKKVVVLLNNLYNKQKNASFYGGNATAIEAVTKGLHAAFSKFASWGGVAVNDLNNQ